MQPILEGRGITRRFGQVEALGGADFTVYPGEVCALIGDNGAGKSTLVKILSGADQPDAGQIFFEGEPQNLATPGDAQRLGIDTVYQDLAVAPQLTAWDNLFLGRELVKPGLLGRLGFLDANKMRGRARGEFAELGIKLPSPSVEISRVSGGQRQSVAIARAAMWANKVIFMDEPTAALGVVQTERVLELIRSIRDRGIAVVLVSHNMPQVIDIADRIEVLRLGRRVDVVQRGEATVSRLVTSMTSGRPEANGIKDAN